MSEKKENFKSILILSVVLSLIVGGASGVLASLFIPNYLQSLPGADKVFGRTTSLISVQEESNTIESVKKVAPAVVSIVVSKELKYDFSSGLPKNMPSIKPGEKQEIGGGTGFIVSTDGYIITNKHVVMDETADYTVVMNDNQKYPAKIIGKDFNNDLAVLKIEAKNLPAVVLGDSDALQLGQTVLAIGYTLGEYKNTVTKGIVSGIDRSVIAGGASFGTETLQELIQTDAAINPGNSGGPLLSLQGQVIGINTAVNLNGASIGFAIPSNVVKRVVDSILKYGRIVRPWLGIRYFDINAESAKASNLPYNYGAYIARGGTPEETPIVKDSPAAKAGLQEGDLIFEINGIKLDQSPLYLELQKYNPGDEVTLKVWRDKVEKIIKVKLEERK